MDALLPRRTLRSLPSSIPAETPTTSSRSPTLLPPSPTHTRPSVHSIPCSFISTPLRRSSIFHPNSSEDPQRPEKNVTRTRRVPAVCTAQITRSRRRHDSYSLSIIAHPCSAMPDDVPLHFRYLDNLIPIPLDPPQSSAPAVLWPASGNEAAFLTAALAAVNSHCDLVAGKVQDKLSALQRRFSCFIHESEEKYDALASSHAEACATLRSYETERRSKCDRVLVNASTSTSIDNVSSVVVAHADAAIGTSDDPSATTRSDASIQTEETAAIPPLHSRTSIYSVIPEISDPPRDPVIYEQLEEDNKALHLENSRLRVELEQYNSAFRDYILAAVAAPPASASVDPTVLSGDVPPPISPDDSPEVATLKAELQKKDDEIKQLDQRCNRYLRKSVAANTNFVALRKACVCMAAAAMKPGRKELVETTTQESDSRYATPCPPKATTTRKRAIGRKGQVKSTPRVQAVQPSHSMPVAGPSSAPVPTYTPAQDPAGAAPGPFASTSMAVQAPPVVAGPQQVILPSPAPPSGTQQRVPRDTDSLFGPSPAGTPLPDRHDSYPQIVPPSQPWVRPEPGSTSPTIPHAGPSAPTPAVPPRGIKKPQEYARPGRSVSASTSSDEGGDGQHGESSDSDVILVEGLGKGTGYVHRRRDHDALDMHAPEEWEMGDDDDDDEPVFVSASASASVSGLGLGPGRGKRKKAGGAKAVADNSTVKRKRAKTLHGPPMTPTPGARARTPMPSTQNASCEACAEVAWCYTVGSECEVGQGDEDAGE
ncbi:hypothetical protein EVG20_g7582 [Dentipellis fragilis]|uniref:Uncharacterized protein n=1 Tax=Dentipellis fragilis TaxID=205917 RepID=A0A4Y9YEY2_9AGAM|nr:hypothetical protein EVG20_g7582 [Dentipellis fragilis]